MRDEKTLIAIDIILSDFRLGGLSFDEAKDMLYNLHPLPPIIYYEII